MTQHFGTIVIGCGVMGSSVSFSLAERGVKVLNLEQFGPNHDKGSSHGLTRIFRQAYYEDERYVPMLKRALELWRRLEVRVDRKLFVRTGGLMIGKTDGELVAGARRSARLHALNHRMMSANDVNDRFEAFNLGEELSALYEYGAGFLYLEECVDSFVSLAKQAGAEFRFYEGATRWRRATNCFEVETPKDVYSAEKIVLCGGPWMTRFVGGLVPLVCERQVQFWFPSDGEARFQADKMPVFISEEGGSAFYYGVPDVGRGVKVARSHGGRTVDPDLVDRTVSQEDLAPVDSFISRRMRGLEGRPTRAATCIYTNTPDRNFVIGPHPSEPGVIIVSACSGHGFKLASVIGEMVADLAATKSSPFDISFLSPMRFTSTSANH